MARGRDAHHVAATPGDTLYETDFYAWSQQQAAVLRGMARETVSLPNALDIENVAEEIEGVAKGS